MGPLRWVWGVGRLWGTITSLIIAVQVTLFAAYARGKVSISFCVRILLWILLCVWAFPRSLWTFQTVTGSALLPPCLLIHFRLSRIGLACYPPSDVKHDSTSTGQTTVESYLRLFIPGAIRQSLDLWCVCTETWEILRLFLALPPNVVADVQRRSKHGRHPSTSSHP